jgi:hypothetical protein
MTSSSSDQWSFLRTLTPHDPIVCTVNLQNEMILELQSTKVGNESRWSTLVRRLAYPTITRFDPSTQNQVELVARKIGELARREEQLALQYFTLRQNDSIQSRSLLFRYYVDEIRTSSPVLRAIARYTASDEGPRCLDSNAKNWNQFAPSDLQMTDYLATCIRSAIQHARSQSVDVDWVELAHSLGFETPVDSATLSRQDTFGHRYFAVNYIQQIAKRLEMMAADLETPVSDTDDDDDPESDSEEEEEDEEEEEEEEGEESEEAEQAAMTDDFESIRDSTGVYDLELLRSDDD